MPIFDENGKPMKLHHFKAVTENRHSRPIAACHTLTLVRFCCAINNGNAAVASKKAMSPGLLKSCRVDAILSPAIELEISKVAKKIPHPLRKELVERRATPYPANKPSIMLGTKIDNHITNTVGRSVLEAS